MKKCLGIFLLFLGLLVTGCTTSNDLELKIINDNQIIMTINEEANLPTKIKEYDVTWEVDDESVALIQGLVVVAISNGSTTLSAYSNSELIEQYVIIVNEIKPKSVEITGDNHLLIGQSTTLEATTVLEYTGEYTWDISDSTIASIEVTDQKATITALKEGLVVVTAKIGDISKDFYILCQKVQNEEIISDIFKTDEVVINAGGLSNVLYPLISSAFGYSYQLNGYRYNRLQTTGTLLIYKRETIDTGYKYYAVTNRHTIENCTRLEANINGSQVAVDIVQYDPKVDLAVVEFTNIHYLPVATFANSDNIATGEFVISISNQNEYPETATLGVVSHPKRYISIDTDNDDISDWDAQYIQHDAPLSEGSSGGPLINMRGEVIGINTTKISSDKIENMGFAIPSNLVLDLIEVLETGKQPNRPVLGVTVRSVIDILRSEYLMDLTPIPDGVTYGMYIIEVDASGLASKAGIQPNDILLKMRGIEIRYSYILRSEIGKSFYGSNEEVEIVVFRDGQEVTLTVVF